MVSALRAVLTKVMLPQMRHLMHQGREHLFRAAILEMRRVQRDLIDMTAAIRRAKALASEIPVGMAPVVGFPGASEKIWNMCDIFAISPGKTCSLFPETHILMSMANLAFCSSGSERRIIAHVPLSGDNAWSPNMNATHAPDV